MMTHFTVAPVKNKDQVYTLFGFTLQTMNYLIIKYWFSSQILLTNLFTLFPFRIILKSSKVVEMISVLNIESRN